MASGLKKNPLIHHFLRQISQVASTPYTLWGNREIWEETWPGPAAYHVNNSTTSGNVAAFRIVVPNKNTNDLCTHRICQILLLPLMDSFVTGWHASRIAYYLGWKRWMHHGQIFSSRNNFILPVIPVRGSREQFWERLKFTLTSCIWAWKVPVLGTTLFSFYSSVHEE